jgi:hypothetical protein
VSNRCSIIIFCKALFAIAFLQAAEPQFSSQSQFPKSRVIIVEQLEATRAFLAQPEKIPSMVQTGITALTGQKNPAAAWRSFFSTNDVIGIKVYSAPGAQSGTRPAVVGAVVESLLASGHPAQKIIIWDKQLTSLRLAGFDEIAGRYQVRLAGSAQAGWDEKSFYENSILGTPVWGDFEFEKKGETIGRKSYVSKLVTGEITKIINITPMLNHNHAGVTGNLYSLALGSVDNSIRFENNSERLATAVPEIWALPEIYDRAVLNIVDALICQYQGEERSLVHYSVPLNQLRFSKDPVALDVLSIRELSRQRELAGIPRVKNSPEL